MALKLIYADDRMIAFTMFARDEDNEDLEDKYWLWRFMIDKSLQGKGYGHLALKEIIKIISFLHYFIFREYSRRESNPQLPLRRTTVDVSNSAGSCCKMSVNSRIFVGCGRFVYHWVL